MLQNIENYLVNVDELAGVVHDEFNREYIVDVRAVKYYYELFELCRRCEILSEHHMRFYISDTAKLKGSKYEAIVNNSDGQSLDERLRDG